MKLRPATWNCVLNALNEGLVYYGFASVGEAMSFMLTLRYQGYSTWIEPVWLAERRRAAAEEGWTQ